MSTLFPGKPPRWATDPVSGPGAVEPLEAKKTEGYDNGVEPPAGEHNWIFQQWARWILAARASRYLSGWLPASGDTVGGGGVPATATRNFRAVRALITNGGSGTFADLRWVAVGDLGTVMVCTAAHPQKNWLDRTGIGGLAAWVDRFWDITYDPNLAALGRVLIVGENDGFFTSDDQGTTWVQRTPAGVPGGSYLGCAFSSTLGRYIAAGATGAQVTVQHSPDGIAWVDGGPPTVDCSAVGPAIWDHLNGQFVVAGHGDGGTTAYIATSPTGLPGTWTRRALPITAPIGALAIGDVYQDAGAGVMLAADNVGAQLIRSTDGGVTWSIVPLPADNTVTFKKLKFGGGAFFATDAGLGAYGNKTGMAVSADGLDWSPTPLPFDTSTVDGQLEINDVAVVSGDNVAPAVNLWPDAAVVVGREVINDRVYIGWTG